LKQAVAVAGDRGGDHGYSVAHHALTLNKSCYTVSMLALYVYLVSKLDGVLRIYKQTNKADLVNTRGIEKD
jgi:hypothetical protein